MQNNPFLESMQAHSDNKLKEIVEAKRGDYQPEAVAAAEHILKKRNITFKEPEPDEHVEMTYDEIREDIRKRRVKGQSMSSIRAYYKECGVDIDIPEIKGEDVEVPSQPWSYGKIRAVFFLIGAGAAFIVHLNDKGDHDTLKVIFYAIAGIALIWFLLSLRKK